MKAHKFRRKKTNVDLADAMVEPIRGVPNDMSFEISLPEYVVIKLRGLTGKSRPKDLAKEIRTMLIEHIRSVEFDDVAERYSDLKSKE